LHSAIRSCCVLNERAVLRLARRMLFSAAGGTMLDLVLLLSTAAFFGLSWGYARLMEKL